MPRTDTFQNGFFTIAFPFLLASQPSSPNDALAASISERLSQQPAGGDPALIDFVQTKVKGCGPYQIAELPASKELIAALTNQAKGKVDVALKS